MMICDKCGYKTRKNIKYCPQCGIELTETKDSNTKNKFWEYLQKVKKNKQDIYNYCNCGNINNFFNNSIFK